MADRPPVTAHVRFEQQRKNLEGRELSDIFQYIFDTNLWGSDESRSGLGSAVDETATLRRAIPAVLKSLGATSLLDVPCGDFGWMSRTELGEVDYIGADIVETIVARNRAEFSGPKRRFERLDLTRDALPRVDVVLCRDCLVHFSYENIFRALRNLVRSGSGYLLTTTFTEPVENHDIHDGDWRMLNFEQPPFDFPRPLAVIVEGCTEAGGAYADKSLGLWKLADLKL